MLYQTNYTMFMSDDTSQLDVWNEFILDGNSDALSRIYFHYYDFLFDLGLRYSFDKQTVEDVIQDIFINFINHRKSIGNVKNLTGYLISTFRRQLFLDQKNHQKVILTEQLPEERFDYFKSQEQNILDNENTVRLHSVIKQCLDKLTVRQREIIFLRFEKEISYEEISLALKISVDSCYKSTYRSIKSIRFEVEKILGKGTKIFFMILFRSIRNQ